MNDEPDGFPCPICGIARGSHAHMPKPSGGFGPAIETSSASDRLAVARLGAAVVTVGVKYRPGYEPGNQKAAE